MSEMVEAFRELLDAQEEAIGVRQRATVGSVANLDCIISEMTFDAIIAYGGKAESGGFVLQIAKEDFPSAPAKLSTVSITRDSVTTSLVLQSLVENNGVYHLTCFDPVAHE